MNGKHAVRTPEQKVPSPVFSQQNTFSRTVFLYPRWCCDQHRPGCTCVWMLRSFRTQRSFPQTITAIGSLFIPSCSLTHITVTHPQGRKHIKEVSLFFYTRLPRPLSGGWALARLFTPLQVKEIATGPCLHSILRITLGGSQYNTHFQVFQQSPANDEGHKT